MCFYFGWRILAFYRFLPSGLKRKLFYIMLLQKNVSTQQNHLLYELPFCVNSKTGNLCLQINIFNECDIDIAKPLNIF